MDQRNRTTGSSQPVMPDMEASARNRDLRRMIDAVELKDTVTARRVQKADREKLRRDRMNEQFVELGRTLEPDRPKNDKATILTDTIQLLKDLTGEANRLKAEYTALSEESCQLMQEKNELREEKATLKSDIESLNAQYQHRLMVPWPPVDPSVVMAPPPYSYPIPVAISPAPISMHPSIQPFPFFRHQNPNAIPSPCSTFIPYSASASPPTEQGLVQHASFSNVSSKQDSKARSLNHGKSNHVEKCDGDNDVATNLELKTPGSSAKQNIPNRERKGKQTPEKERRMSTYNASSPSMDSSSQSQVTKGSSFNYMNENSKSSK